MPVCVAKLDIRMFGLMPFFKSSTDIYSSSICLAQSMSAASAGMKTDMR